MESAPSSLASIFVHFDGSSRGNPGQASCGYEIVTRDQTIRRGVKLGVKTNNEAEYYGIIYALEAVLPIVGQASVIVLGDSKLVIEQVSNRWKVKAANLRPLHRRASQLVRDLNASLRWIPRSKNAVADRLASDALDEIDEYSSVD